MIRLRIRRCDLVSPHHLELGGALGSNQPEQWELHSEIKGRWERPPWSAWAPHISISQHLCETHVHGVSFCFILSHPIASFLKDGGLFCRFSHQEFNSPYCLVSPWVRTGKVSWEGGSVDRDTWWHKPGYVHSPGVDRASPQPQDWPNEGCGMARPLASVLPFLGFALSLGILPSLHLSISTLPMINLLF